MVTDARSFLLRHMSEANFERWVMREAARHGICGFHVRLSEASVAGVHTQRMHGHSDAHGWPDWCFVGPGGILFRELKGQETRVTPHQKRWHELLECAGANVGVWRPIDEHTIRETFRRLSQSTDERHSLANQQTVERLRSALIRSQ